MVDKFSGSDRKAEFEGYTKTMNDFEAVIFQDMKSKVYQMNRRLQEMNELLNERIN
jgi:hypothetical protein